MIEHFFDSEAGEFVWPVWSKGYVWSDEVHDRRQVAAGVDREEALRTLRADPYVDPQLYIGEFAPTVELARERKKRKDELSAKQKKALSIPLPSLDFEQPPFLIPMLGDGEWRLTRPVDCNTPLFNELEKVDGQEQMKTFADTYGNLAKGVVLGPSDTRGVSLDTWTQELASIKWVVKAMESFHALEADGGSNGERREARQFLDSMTHWEQYDPTTGRRKHSEDVVQVRMPHGFRTYRFERSPGQLHNDAARKSHLPMRLALRDVINEKINEHEVHPRLLYDEEHDRMISRIYPTSLVGAVWMQLLKWTVGEQACKRCVLCGEWVNVTGKRASWTGHAECHDAKRQRDYQNKKKQDGGSR
ncbi:MAG: hypothetical protein ACYC99_08995 [Candidatus Geothermincolia bacterium]